MLPKAHLTSHSRMSGRQNKQELQSHILQDENHNHRKLTKMITWITALPWQRDLRNSVTLWQNMVHWRREGQPALVFSLWEPCEQYEKASWWGERNFCDLSLYSDTRVTLAKVIHFCRPQSSHLQNGVSDGSCKLLWGLNETAWKQGLARNGASVSQVLCKQQRLISRHKH